MRIPIWPTWFGNRPSAPAPSNNRAALRIGMPKVLNVWSTHQFWLGFLTTLGIPARHIVFSSDTSEEQSRTFGTGRGTVESCYPVKCMSGHYGELIFGQKHPLDVLLSPMIASLPSFLHGQVLDTLACPRVMAAPENIKAGFLKEADVFAAHGLRYVSPFVTLGEPQTVPRQLYTALKDVLDLEEAETEAAVAAGYAALDTFNRTMQAASRDVLAWCAREGRPCLLVLGRPYHMDPGIGHAIEAELQAHGYPILWSQHFPLDTELLAWLFHDDLRVGRIRHPLEIADVWRSSYSSNTNEILWGAKVGTRCPWTTGVLHFSSYECGMDQPTYTPVQKIVEATGTLYFKFGDLDATKPAGGIKIRVQTIAHYMQKHSPALMARKRAWLPQPGPL